MSGATEIADLAKQVATLQRQVGMLQRRITRDPQVTGRQYWKRVGSGANDQLRPDPAMMGGVTEFFVGLDGDNTQLILSGVGGGLSLAELITDGTIHLTADVVVAVNGKLYLAGLLTAGTVGTVIRKVGIYDLTGAVIGWVPIYDTIT